MKITKAIGQRIISIIVSLAMVILNLFNFTDAWAEGEVSKMGLSVLGFAGFLWIAFIAFFQIRKLKSKE